MAPTSNNPEYVPINYRDFYDVPRLLVVYLGEERILLDSNFDDDTEDYTGHYRVYRMKDGFEPPSNGSWETIVHEAVEELGSIPISAVQFDATRRRLVKADVFDRFLLGG